MAPSVQRAKTAFQFFQSEKIKEVKKELGCSMGDAMSELSSRWKSMDAAARAPFLQSEADDRERYRIESAKADALAAQEQQQRRDNLVAKEGEAVSQRGARARMDNERAQEEARQRKMREQRLAEIDPEVLAERKRIRDKKRKETAERQRKREEQEKAVEERHKKLDKSETLKAKQRLDYLLQQSSVFAKLKMGADHEVDEAAAAAAAALKNGGKSNGDAKSSNKSHHRSSKKIAKDTEEDEDSGDEREEHIFLTRQPHSIKGGTLKPYQLEGLNWMIHLSEKGLNGILADEMGLGKTLQSISILAYNFDFLKIQGPHLICVPKSTLSNWMNELKRWCPALRAIRFHGNREEREQLVANYFTNEAAAHDGRRPRNQIRNEETGEMEDDNSDNPRAWDVCVTTYEICNTEKKALSKFAWRYLVIDEAHRLKNEASMFSKTVRTFHTTHRLLLTGTPLQNNLHELWALLNFLLPDIFSSAEQFDDWFNLEIDDEDAKKDMISQLHKILRPFMIRRLKSDVAKGLPPKTETLLLVGMSAMQKKLYKQLLLRDIDSITGSNSGKNRTAILNIVMQLRKCCGHPYLFEGVEDRTLDPLGEHLVENCGKLNLVDKLLKKLRERGSRVLIFTQMTKILDILEDFMVMRGYKYCRIDGNTNYDDREAAIDTFNAEGSEKFCFLLSTRAGGLGINLQTADTCILYDSDWNPQADLQAQDRCHRLGQKKPVHIYRLVSENTVEEKIVERAQQKLKLDAMVVQQGRLKDKDKVSKEEIMNAVRFGADAVFRSEESTITDDDIDAILERGKIKTKELADKIKKAEKGNLLDFRLDAGVSAQTFEGIDYSDRELRNQLRILAADSLGKRDRRPPPTNYNPVLAPKKTMVVGNTRVKLPRSLRLPSMEDHHFYNRERLLELGDLEFQTYATLKGMGQLPPRDYIDKSKTLLPPELAQEKLELLEEGFGQWTRSQYFHFVKAAAKYGRDDTASIAADMDLPEETVSEYSTAFWKYAPTELKEDEWERVKTNVERGEKKIEKKRKLSRLLKRFVNTFENPRTEMYFANKGTTHFALDQDRALLCAVDAHGYGNWDAVREELRKDAALTFQHTVQGMNTDALTKRCDYRMRQMEKEFESREKELKNRKPAAVVAAEAIIADIKEIELFEEETRRQELFGRQPPEMSKLSPSAEEQLDERMQERQPCIDRLREIEIQVRGCKKLADVTREAIHRGDQYVNYSNITLKSGGQRALEDLLKVDASDGDALDTAMKMAVDVEARINPAVLRVPECGECPACVDAASRKLCVKRMEVRKKQLMIEIKRMKEQKITDGDKKTKFGSKKRPKDFVSNAAKGPPTKKKKLNIKANGVVARGASKGNKRMAIPDELVPDFCRMISPNGTGERMKVINQFVDEHPSTSVRQVTFKFSEITTRTLPECIDPPETKKGRTFWFYLRPRCYHMVPESERPPNWEKYAREDEALWREEQAAKKKEKASKEQKLRNMMGDSASRSQTSETDISDEKAGLTAEEPIDDGDETEDEEPVKKKTKKG